MTRIAIFASGSGSNAEKIARYFQNITDKQVSLILTNNANAFVLERAKNMGIPTIVFSKKEFIESETVLEILRDHQIDFVVLAGFLLLVPEYLVEAYPDKIVNIHPALLPKYGGKGMYGDKVHQAVREAGDEESGITIHYVNSRYDEGQIVFQARCPVTEEDTPESIAQKVHALEYQHYPQVIEQLINKSIKNL
ncbi:Phosphoribosylglycinamide formyltransferase [Fulvivirga imtechensis AK7]|uniref:Phosphoribosylglycinamide formyltransferase n=1 Tax=Fulvivirga imtechensis AK7 TaxID=1237149 RepID=L8JV25_9BACT|nr:phosphoribosylglycinamide formyltransferase [Fulvivirga imtechensis]ELR72645.1 Phosphoribosylglycinamide formyltransferase [Fulvivirga imtechensis AK7]